MSSGLDWERFGVITGGDEVCILPPPTLSEKGVGIPTFVYFPSSIIRLYNSKDWRRWEYLAKAARMRSLANEDATTYCFFAADEHNAILCDEGKY